MNTKLFKEAETNSEWMRLFKEKVENANMLSNNIGGHGQRCIYRVPVWLKEHVSNGNVEIISFGPYHQGEKGVAEMEKHKLRCLNKMLQRQDQKIELYLYEMTLVENDVRDCYEEIEPLNISSNDFVEMLLLDGCFMLEFLRVKKLGLEALQCYNNDDSVFSKHTIMQVIARDMIKLENQLPLRVLQRIIEIQGSNNDLKDLVLRALPLTWINNENLNQHQIKAMITNNVISSNTLHCLDIFRSSLLYQLPATSPPAPRSTQTSFCQVINNVMNCILRRPHLSYEEIKIESERMVYCVEDLSEAGVKFKARTSQNNGFWDLKFDKGLLEIPPIKIDDATKTVFLNLIAYEQCHLRSFRTMHITGYVAFMDNLINSAADVRQLRQAGIIVHRLGSDVEVADMFNCLVKKVVIDRQAGNLSTIYKELNLYCTHRRHQWSASWRIEYLKNPWVIISVIAAVVLFLQAIAQTVIAAVALCHGPVL